MLRKRAFDSLPTAIALPIALTPEIFDSLPESCAGKENNSTAL